MSSLLFFSIKCLLSFSDDPCYTNITGKEILLAKKPFLEYVDSLKNLIFSKDWLGALTEK